MFAATKLKLFKLSFNNCAPKLPYTLTQLTQPNPTNVNICLCVCACISLWSLLPLLLLWALSKNFCFIYPEINFIYC